MHQRECGNKHAHGDLGRNVGVGVFDRVPRGRKHKMTRTVAQKQSESPFLQSTKSDSVSAMRLRNNSVLGRLFERLTPRPSIEAHFLSWYFQVNHKP